MAAPEDEPDFALTAGEINSPLWRRLTEHFETQLKNLRGRNDGPLDPEQTAMIRGQIQTLKGLIALGEYEPPITQ
jgi:hypothetical protein